MINEDPYSFGQILIKKISLEINNLRKKSKYQHFRLFQKLCPCVCVFEVYFNGGFLSDILNFPLPNKLSSHTTLRPKGRLFVFCLFIKEHFVHIHENSISTKIMGTWWTIFLAPISPTRMSRFNIPFPNNVCAIGLLANHHIFPIFFSSHLIFY